MDPVGSLQASIQRDRDAEPWNTGIATAILWLRGWAAAATLSTSPIRGAGMGSMVRRQTLQSVWYWIWPVLIFLVGLLGYLLKPEQTALLVSTGICSGLIYFQRLRR